MCIGCPDFIDICFECDERPGKGMSFYADDKYCVHMQKKHGHEIATFKDQELGWEHDD